MISAEFLASGRAWVLSALPVSSAMILANSSARASTASAIFCRMRPRSRHHLALAGKGRGRRLHGAIDTLGIAARDAGEKAALARALAPDPVTEGAANPIAVDQHLDARRLGCGGRRTAHRYCHRFLLRSGSRPASISRGSGRVKESLATPAAANAAARNAQVTVRIAWPR